MRRVRPDGTESNNVSMLALGAKTDMIEPMVLEGRWLLPEDDNALVLNTGVTQNDSGVHVGDRITLKIGERETSWVVVGLVRSVMTGPLMYANKPYFEQVMRNTGHTSTLWVVGKGHDTASRVQLTNDLKAAYKASGYQYRRH